MLHKKVISVGCLALLCCHSIYAEAQSDQIDTWESLSKKDYQELVEKTQGTELSPEEALVLDTYKKGIEASLAGRFREELSLLEEAYHLCESQGPNGGEECVFYSVLRINWGHTRVLDRIYISISKLFETGEYSYEDRIRELDRVSRIDYWNQTIQATLLSTMLERMNWDAVLHYCNVRISEEQGYYSVLRAELRLLSQYNSNRDQIFASRFSKIRKELESEAQPGEEVSDQYVREVMINRYVGLYDPTGLDSPQVDIMLAEIQDDDTRNVNMLVEYCRLLKKSYVISHQHKAEILDYFSRAKAVINGPGAVWKTISEFNTPEWKRQQAATKVEKLEAEFKKLVELFESEKYEEWEPYNTSTFPVSLKGRKEFEAEQARSGAQVQYLDYEDVFGK